MHYRWLGQGCFYFRFDNGTSVLIDPYFSNSVGKPRKLPIDPAWFSLKPDVILLTHDHLDHTDPESLTPFLKQEKRITVLASHRAWEHVRSLGYPQHNYVQLDAGREWSEGGVRFTAVFAAHSDPYAIGAVLEYRGARYYITGDTLYDERILASVTPPIRGLFVCINGEGNNMNMTDAARFADRINADFTVPMHFGMFDTLDPAPFFKMTKGVQIPIIDKEICDESN